MDHWEESDVVYHGVLACNSCKAILLCGDDESEENKLVNVRGPEIMSQQTEQSGHRRSYFVVKQPSTVIPLDRDDDGVMGILWEKSSGLSACIMYCKCGIAYGYYLLAAMDAQSIQKYCGHVWASADLVSVFPMTNGNVWTSADRVSVFTLSTTEDEAVEATAKSFDKKKESRARALLMLHWKCLRCEHINDPRQKCECRYVCEECGMKRPGVGEEIGADSGDCGQYWGELADDDFVGSQKIAIAEQNDNTDEVEGLFDDFEDDDLCLLKIDVEPKIKSNTGAKGFAAAFTWETSPDGADGAEPKTGAECAAIAAERPWRVAAKLLTIHDSIDKSNSNSECDLQMEIFQYQSELRHHYRNLKMFGGLRPRATWKVKHPKEGKQEKQRRIQELELAVKCARPLIKLQRLMDQNSFEQFIASNDEYRNHLDAYCAPQIDGLKVHPSIFRQIRELESEIRDMNARF